MSELLLALLTGAAVGVVFAVVGLQPPAPATWAGVLGIVGIVGAWQIAERVLG